MAGDKSMLHKCEIATVGKVKINLPSSMYSLWQPEHIVSKIWPHIISVFICDETENWKLKLYCVATFIVAYKYIIECIVIIPSFCWMGLLPDT